jgi:hypothetical protein
MNRHKNIKDLEGQRFGRLIVWEYKGSGKDQKARWVCKCDCGKEVIVHSQSLLRGNTQSCGCLQKELLIKRRAKTS